MSSYQEQLETCNCETIMACFGCDVCIIRGLQRCETKGVLGFHERFIDRGSSGRKRTEKRYQDFLLRCSDWDKFDPPGPMKCDQICVTRKGKEEIYEVVERGDDQVFEDIGPVGVWIRVFTKRCNVDLDHE